MYKVGDSFYNGYVRYVITDLREKFPGNPYIETHKISDKYGQWKGTYLIKLDTIQEEYFDKGYAYCKKDHFEKGTFHV